MPWNRWAGGRRLKDQGIRRSGNISGTGSEISSAGSYLCPEEGGGGGVPGPGGGAAATVGGAQEGGDASPAPGEGYLLTSYPSNLLPSYRRVQEFFKENFLEDKCNILTFFLPRFSSNICGFIFKFLERN